MCSFSAVNEHGWKYFPHKFTEKMTGVTECPQHTFVSLKQHKVFNTSMFLQPNSNRHTHFWQKNTVRAAHLSLRTVFGILHCSTFPPCVLIADSSLNFLVVEMLHLTHI